MKPCCDKVVIVEGKYDKIRLESVLEATILTTDGFGLFQNKEKRALFRRLAQTRGLVVLSDSDGAGSLIRSHIRTITGGEGVINLYIPPMPGKERRKTTPSKEGLLGVEGMDNETLLNLFEQSGLISSRQERRRADYTKAQLYEMGYFGTTDAKEKRERVLKENGLPKNLSSNAFLDVVNLLELVL